MKKLLLTALLATGTISLSAQTISIPDPIFEQVLINTEIDSDGVINGQISEADALAVTSLTVISPNLTQGEYIQTLTGIEAFINLENLTIHSTEIEQLNISTLINLKHLDCADNLLTSLDVSSNFLLEYLDISSSGDVIPINQITEIDLSNNPAINTIWAIGPINYINLKNGSNNPQMNLYIDYSFGNGSPEILGNTCIEVDDVIAAQNNESPYSEWFITYSNKTINFATNCSLATEDFNKTNISVYPNPTSDVLHFQTTGGTTIDTALIFDISGRSIKEFNNINSSISVSELQTGTYIIKLASGKETFTQKIIKK